MKKFVFFLVLFVIFTVNIQAISVNPSSGTMTKGGTSTINIYATPGTTSDAVALVRLGINNASIVSFTKGATFDAVAGPCASGATDNGTNLCFDIFKLSGVIASNELIGTITVKWASVDGIATITRIAGSGYWNGTVFTKSEGVAGTYTLGTAGTIPKTPLELNISSEVMLAGSGLTLFFLGIYLFQYLSHEKKQQHEEGLY